MPRFCSACGTQVSTAFCTRCGTPTGLGAPSASSPRPAAPPHGQPPLLPPAGSGAPWGAPPDPAAAQRRNAIVIGVVAALVLAGGAAWALTEGGGGGRDQEVTVDITLYDEAYFDIDDDERCTGEDAGYDDLGADSPVVFRDSDGDVVGRTRLGVGVVAGDGCEFSVETEVDLVSEYEVEVGGEFVEAYGRDELEDQDWEVVLEIGESEGDF